MSIFDSALSLVGNVAKVALAPVEVVVAIADAAVQPIADISKEVVDGAKSPKEDV